MRSFLKTGAPRDPRDLGIYAYLIYEAHKSICIYVVYLYRDTLYYRSGGGGGCYSVNIYIYIYICICLHGDDRELIRYLP